MFLSRKTVGLLVLLSGAFLSGGTASANNAGYKLYWNGPDDTGNYNILFTGMIKGNNKFRYSAKQRKAQLARIDRDNRRKSSRRRFRHSGLSLIGVRPHRARRSCRSQRAAYLASGTVADEQAYRRCRRGR